MKKSKFVLMSLILIVFLGFSLFFVPTGVKAASDDESDELDIEQVWELVGLPPSAIDFVDDDGRGVKFFIINVVEFTDPVSGIVLDYVSLIPVKDYYFDDGIMDADLDLYPVPYIQFFSFSETLLSMISYYLNTYPYGIGPVIPEWDRIIVSWDVDQQMFVGPDYLSYCIDESYDEGYQEGITVNHEAAYYEGYDTGYGAGYVAGYDDARPELDILLITLIMYILSIIIYFKFNLKWVLIATTLLWFVPIFLVENLFVKIFCVIMIIATITITFFSDREEEF
jgi:hypothetical protein